MPSLVPLTLLAGWSARQKVQSLPSPRTLVSTPSRERLPSSSRSVLEEATATSTLDLMSATQEYAPLDESSASARPTWTRW